MPRAKTLKKKTAEEKGNTCLSCKKAEAPNLPGATFTSSGDNGMIVTFWLCDQCAIPLGPGQGPIDMDDPTQRV